MDFLSYAEPGYLAEYYGLHDGRLAAMHVWRDDRSGLERSIDKGVLLASVSINRHPQVRALLTQASRADDVVVVDSLTMVDLPRLSRGRVAFLGDAAHCLTLVSGQRPAWPSPPQKCRGSRC